MDTTQYHIMGDPQLFIDDWLIECAQGVTRRWHQPTRLQNEPVLVADRPWEKTPYFTYSNYVVIKDPSDGLIKCWYEDLGPMTPGGHPWRNRLCYAQSRDGVHFEKPELDVVRIDGRRTNVVGGYVDAPDANDKNPWPAQGVHSAAIVIDPHPPSVDARFRMLFSRATSVEGQVRHEIRCARSGDGLHWREYEQPPRLGSTGSHLSDVSTIQYDADARLFVQMTRHGRMYTAGASFPMQEVSGWFSAHCPHRPDLMKKRRVFRTTSADFLNWSELLLVSSPEDDFDNLDEAHYGMAHFKVGRMHFGTLGIFQYVDNQMQVRLVYSRDGMKFKPTNRGNPFLSPRGPGHWDAHMVSMVSPPIDMGDRWWFYHGGAACHHDFWMSLSEGLDHAETREPDKHTRFGMGIAELRREGFASLDAAPPRQGVFVTRPFLSGGTRLAINARCRTHGSIRVEVQDVNGRPLAGRTLDLSDRFTGDQIRHEMTWQSDPTLPESMQFRRVQFLLYDAEIFGFQMLP